MDLQDAIVRSITEVCEEKHLNANGFVNNGTSICWRSTLGILGEIQYYIPFSEFRKSLEHGMRSVSILIAFADLISQETNKGMIDNINEAKKRGAKTYFKMVSPDSKTILMYVPKANNHWDYTTIPIEFTEKSDGDYEWDIPDSAELYSSVYDNDGPSSLEGMTPEDLTRLVSDYTGLGQRLSSGVPVLQASQSARDYGMDIELETIDNIPNENSEYQTIGKTTLTGP